jgi:hypothetical protein
MSLSSVHTIESFGVSVLKGSVGTELPEALNSLLRHPELPRRKSGGENQFWNDKDESEEEDSTGGLHEATPPKKLTLTPAIPSA